MSSVYLESIINHECFWNTITNTLEWLALVVSLLKITFCTYFKKSELKLLFHWKAQLLNLFELQIRLSAAVTGFSI